MEKRKKKKTRMAVNSAASNKKYKQSSRIVAKIVIVIAILVFAVVLIFVSGIFNISEVLVENNHVVSSEQIVSFSGIKLGTNIFSISKKDIVDNVKQNSYVDDVEIKRIFPDKVKLIITEREKEYAIQLANSFVYINEEGYVVEISNEQLQVPIIVGIATDLSNIKANDRLNDDDLQKMNTVAKIMKTAENNELAYLITKIDVSNGDDFVIYMDSVGKTIYLGNGTELNTRFLYIKAILNKQEGKSGKIFVDVDLNSEDVYFREE